MYFLLHVHVHNTSRTFAMDCHTMTCCIITLSVTGYGFSLSGYFTTCKQLLFISSHTSAFSLALALVTATPKLRKTTCYLLFTVRNSILLSNPVSIWTLSKSDHRTLHKFVMSAYLVTTSSCVYKSWSFW